MSEPTEQPNEIRVDLGTLLAYLCHDADFTAHKSHVFLHRHSGDFMEVFDDDDAAANAGAG